MKIVTYTTGHRFILDHATMGLHGGTIAKIYDFGEVDEKTKEHIKKNMHNDALLEEIHKKK